MVVGPSTEEAEERWGADMMAMFWAAVELAQLLFYSTAG